MRRGYLLLLLHAHLPFVRHPEYDEYREERWLFEAITESYLPLLDALERLHADRVPYRITLSLSPPLLALLSDRLLQSRYLHHLEALIELSGRERLRTRGQAEPHALAHWYQAWLISTRARYVERYGCDLVRGFLELARAGGLELITSAATHGFLPLLRTETVAVDAQLRVARQAFRAVAGGFPAGLWLPECGYFEGLDRTLATEGFRFAFLESHGVSHARPRLRHGVEQPLASPAGLALFGRDPACSREVWSRDQGYPGHPLYREYHRDIGYELDDGELGTLPAGQPTGLKYHRVTDRRSGNKSWYDPAAAQAQARRHAGDFVRSRLQALGRSRLRDRPPLFTAPYDAELFGHWWFEGPHWVEQVAREAVADGRIELIAASDYLERHPLLPKAEPSPSSWGEGGYNRFWIGGSNAWLYPHLHAAARTLRELADCPGEPETLTRRALNQAARCLLLAQASDWTFIMRSGTAVDYAEGRVRDYLARFHYLIRAVRDGCIDQRRLAALEQMDNIFPGLDFRVFASGESRPKACGEEVRP
jgi:1,4-alpha-glucan branching enzyme